MPALPNNLFFCTTVSRQIDGKKSMICPFIHHHDECTAISIRGDGQALYTDAICVTTTSQYFELGRDNVEFFTLNKEYAISYRVSKEF